MHSFNAAGLGWRLSLNGWQLKKLKERIGFDARDPDSIMQAASDPVLLVDVLYLLCEDQAKEFSVSERQFGEALAGDVLEQAVDAYLKETVDFFPPRQRPALNKMLAKMTDFQNRATAMAEEKIDSPEMESLFQAELTKASRKIDQLLAGTNTGEPSGSLQASPA